MAGRKGGGIYGPKKKRPSRNTTTSIGRVPPRAPVAPRPQLDPLRVPTPPPTAPAYSVGAQTGGMPTSYNPATDPAVAAAQGLAAKMRARAQAVAQAKRIQAAIEYGDPTGVEGLDESQQAAARDNPFSILKNLEHSNEVGTKDLEEGLNKANLFYSGYRGKQLAENARGYQNARYQAGTSFRALQSDIGNNLADALLNADIYEQNALLNSSGGSYGGGYDEGGGGGYSTSAYLSALRGGIGGDRSGVPTYFSGTPTKPRRSTYQGNQNPWRGN